MPKLHDLPTCYFCGNQVFEGHGERAKVITDHEGVKHFHYAPENNVDCAASWQRAVDTMRQMELDLEIEP